MSRHTCLVPLACMASRVDNCRVCGQHERRAREYRERLAALPPIPVPAWVERAGLACQYVAEARRTDEHGAASLCRLLLRKAA